LPQPIHGADPQLLLRGPRHPVQEVRRGVEYQVHVRVEQTRQHGRTGIVVARRRRTCLAQDLLARADGGDPVVGDQDRTVAQR
jgi:hypothetical protein